MYAQYPNRRVMNPYQRAYAAGTYAAKYAVPVGGAYILGKYNKKKTSKKSKPVKKYQKPVVKKVKGIQKQLTQLKKIAESDQGTHIHRVRGSLDKSCAVKSSIFIGGTAEACNTISNLEEVIALLRYYDPSNPATLVTASGATGTFHKEFYFKRSYHKMTIRNNYQVPVRATQYYLLAKESTSITPETAFTNGLSDVGNPSSTSSLVYPTDSPQFNDLYKVDKSSTKLLMPGQEMVMIVSNKPFQYDPSLSDTHNLTYQKIFFGGSFALRLEGVIGHDTTADQQGTLQGGVDIMYDHTYECIYAAGADIKFITVDDQTDTFTNSGVVTSKPVADNIPYSKA